MADEEYAQLQQELQKEGDFNSEPITTDNGYLDNPNVGQEPPKIEGYMEQNNAPEPKPEPEPQHEEPQQEPQKMVPHQALHQQRELNKQLRDEINNYKNQLDTTSNEYHQLKAQVDQMNNSQTEQRMNEMDPIERQQVEIKQLKEQISNISNFNNQIQEQQKMSSAEQALQREYAASVQQYTQQQPDIMDAYRFAINARQQQLQAIGYGTQDIANAIRNDEYDIATRAYQAGDNPGEYIYSFAKSMGYVNQAEQQKQINDQKLQNVNQNLQTQQNLSTVSGSTSNSGELTAESFLNLPEEQQTEEAWRDLMRKY